MVSTAVTTSEDLTKLHGVVSSKFDIGSVDEFSAKMQTPEDRKKFYDLVSSKGFDLGDYNEYESRLSVKKKEQSGFLSRVQDAVAYASPEPSAQQSQPSSKVTEGDVSQFQESYGTGKLKNFEKRLNQPEKNIQNEDGTTSTHKMMSANVDGKEIALPTIVEIDGKLKELSINEAIDHALRTGEYKEFKTQEEAQAYAEGGYKKGTKLDRQNQITQGDVSQFKEDYGAQESKVLPVKAPSTEAIDATIQDMADIRKQMDAYEVGSPERTELETRYNDLGKTLEQETSQRDYVNSKDLVEFYRNNESQSQRKTDEVGEAFTGVIPASGPKTVELLRKPTVPQGATKEEANQIRSEWEKGQDMALQAANNDYAKYLLNQGQEGRVNKYEALNERRQKGEELDAEQQQFLMDFDRESLNAINKVQRAKIFEIGTVADVNAYTTGASALSVEAEKLNKEFQALGIKEGEPVDVATQKKAELLVQKSNELNAKFEALKEQTGFTDELQDEYDDAINGLANVNTDLRPEYKDARQAARDKKYWNEKAFIEGLSDSPTTTASKSGLATIMQGVVGLGQIPKIWGDVTGDTDYDWVDELNDGSKQVNDAISARVTGVKDGVELSKVSDTYKYAKLMGDAIGSIAMFAAGGAVAKAAKLPTFVGTFTTAFLTSQDDYYNEALAEGMSEQEAAAVGLSLAAITGAIEGAVPDIAYFKSSPFRKSIIQSLRSGKPMSEAVKSAIEAVPASVKSIMKRGTMEAIEETTQQLSEDITKTVINDVMNTDLETFNPEAYKDSAIAGFAAGGGMSTFSRPKPKSPVTEQILMDAVRNPEQTIAYVPAEEQDEVKTQLYEAAQTLSVLEKHPNWERLTPAQQNHVLSEVQRKNTLEQTAKVTGKDEAIMAEIGAIDTEVQQIMSGKPVEQEKIEGVEDMPSKTIDLNPNDTRVAKEVDQTPLTELIGKQVEYDGKVGTLQTEGEILVFESGNQIYEIGNQTELSEAKAGDVGVKKIESVVTTAESGNVTVRGTEYVNNFSKPSEAITRDEDGNILSVTLETTDGKKRTFRGQTAEDVAYEITMAEMSKQPELVEQFETFINENPEANEIVTIGLQEVAEGQTETITPTPPQVAEPEVVAVEPASTQTEAVEAVGNEVAEVEEIKTETEETTPVPADLAKNEAINTLIRRKNKYNKANKKDRITKGQNLLAAIQKEAEALGFKAVVNQKGAITLLQENGKKVMKRGIVREKNDTKTKEEKAKAWASSGQGGIEGGILHLLLKTKFNEDQAELAGEAEKQQARKRGFVSKGNNAKSIDVIAIEDLAEMGIYVKDEQDAIGKIQQALSSYESKQAVLDDLVAMMEDFQAVEQGYYGYREENDLEGEADNLGQIAEYVDELSVAEIEKLAAAFDEYVNTLSEAEKQQIQKEYEDYQRATNEEVEGSQDASNESEKITTKEDREKLEKDRDKAQATYNKAKAEYEKRKAKFDKNAQQNQLDLMGRSAQDEMLFANDLSAQKKLVDDAKREMDKAADELNKAAKAVEENLEGQLEIKAEQPKSKSATWREKAKQIKDSTGGALMIAPKVYAAALELAADVYDAAIAAGKSVSDALKAARKAVNDYLEKDGEYGALSDTDKADTKAELDKEFVDIEDKPKGELRERGWITTMRAATDINDQTKSAFLDDRTLYERLPNAVTVAEAKAIVDAMGVDEAAKMVLTDSKAMPDAFRVTVAQMVIKKYNESGRPLEAAELAMKLAEMATNYGQAIQALSLFGYLTPEGALLVAQRTIDGIRKKQIKGKSKQIKQLQGAINKATKEAANEVAENVAGKVKTTVTNRPPRQKRGVNYGKSNKIVKKEQYEKAMSALKTKMFSAVVPPPELVTVAAYHLEAGSRSFANFSKRMIEDFGSKVKSYLKGAYLAAQSEIGGEGFDSEDVIDSYIQKTLEKDIKETLKSLDVRINDIIKKHYSEVGAVKERLVKKLVDEADLDPSEAAQLAEIIQKEFDRIVEKKKRDAIQRVLSRSQRKKPEYKTLEKKLIEASNQGIIDEAAVSEIVAESLGFAKLSKEQAEEIVRLANKAQQAKEGVFKQRATEDLLKYQAQIKGIDWFDVTVAIWMANVLSGWKTQVVNVAANMYNTVALYANAIKQNPKAARFIAKGLLVGLKKGFLEGGDVIRTGYSPIRDKFEVPPVLERVTFKGGKFNPANYAKYVRRAMLAADSFSFEGLKQMRSFQLAYKLAASQKEAEPDLNVRNRALEILNRSSDALPDAIKRANDEYREQVDLINASEISEKEKAKKRKQAKRDEHRRIYEFLEESRPVEITQEAHNFAARGTYNIEPEGLLGQLTKGVNTMLRAVPVLRFVIPFTNVITNVMNETINYTPYGFLRGVRGGSGTGGDKFQKQAMTEQQKVDLMTKAQMGTTVLVAMYVLSVMGDDDDEPVLEITANGFNDYAKNDDLRQTGWRPYSFRVKMPNGEYSDWISYKETPLAVGMGFLGSLNDSEKYRKAKFNDEYYTKLGIAFTGIARQIADGTFISSGETFLSNVLSNKHENMFGYLSDFVNKTATSLVIPNIITQTAQTYYDFMDVPDKEIRETYLGRALRVFPVARDKYSNKVNGLGREISPEVDVIVAIGEPDEDDKLFQLLADKKNGTGAPSRNSVTVLDETKLDQVDAIYAEQRKLLEKNKPTESDLDKIEKLESEMNMIMQTAERHVTDEEFYVFQVVRGSLLREFLRVNYEELKSLDETSFGDILAKAKGNATTEAKFIISDSKNMKANFDEIMQKDILESVGASLSE